MSVLMLLNASSTASVKESAACLSPIADCAASSNDENPCLKKVSLSILVTRRSLA